jgi:hypothetical protein
MMEKRILYYDSHAVGAGKEHMKNILKYLIDEDEGQHCIKPDEWALVTSTKSVPQQENTFDCGAFICMFGYFISQDASLLFNQANVTSFQKLMALAVINLANNAEVQADSVEASPSNLSDKQEIEPVGCNVPQGFPDHEILSSTNDGFYVAKLHDKLPQNAINYLQEYINKCFEENKLAERQFKYYQTISNENAELEMNVFSLAKGLLKGLNQGKDQSNEFAPYKAEVINSKEYCCQVNAPTKHNTTPLAAYIVVPMWDKNDESITINLRLQQNGENLAL